MKVLCARCEEVLGSVGASVVGMNPNPVWRIQPGWVFIDPATGRRARDDKLGILERRDDEHRQEERLRHELDSYGAIRGDRVPIFARRDPQIGVRREANLPLCVRCPRCHAVRLVTVEALLRARAAAQRRVHTGST